MSKKVQIYQCWSGEDMAQSDTWYSTLKEAREHAKEAWGVPASSIKFDADGYWDGTARGDSDIAGYDVHVTRHSITMTADGICSALTFLPNR